MWIDLLNQQTEFELARDPEELLQRWNLKKTKWIVIDEVQKIPRLLDVVHRAIETYKIKFALTGSSARKLRRGHANLLANRTASFYLSPFSSFELSNQFDLSKALRFGLLPRFWSDEALSTQDIERALYSYLNSYLKEEVAAEQLVRSLDPFRRFLVAAAQSNGKIINFAKIERDAGISHSQADRHFEILCDTLLGRYLPPYERSVRKRQSKKSKFYLFDTGVVRTINNLVGESLHVSTYEYGELFETFVVNEFFKLKESFEKPWNFSYLRTKNNLEIDLVIEKPRGNPILVEIKSTQRVTEDQLSNFIALTKNFKNPERYVLSRDPNEREIQGVRCLLWNKGIAEIFGTGRS